MGRVYHYKGRAIQVSPTGYASIVEFSGAVDPIRLYDEMGANTYESFLALLNKWNRSSNDLSGIYYTYWEVLP